MPNPSSIPQSVIDKDHELDNRAARAGEALAKFRWQQTLDPAGPQYPFKTYGRAVGRNDRVIAHSAHGYALFVERQGAVPGTSPFTIEDAIRLSQQSIEQQAFTEAIAEGSGEPIGRIARGDNQMRPLIIDEARQRAERRGTDPIDEAREIATLRRKSAESAKKQKETKAKNHTMRFIVLDGYLAQARALVLKAIAEGEGVAFDAEEMELLRATVANLRACMDLLDLRMDGAPDIDWDAEMANLKGQV